VLFTPVIYVISGFRPYKIFGLICILVKKKSSRIPLSPIQLSKFAYVALICLFFFNWPRVKKNSTSDFILKIFENKFLKIKKIPKYHKIFRFFSKIKKFRKNIEIFSEIEKKQKNSQIFSKKFKNRIFFFRNLKNKKKKTICFF